MSEGKPGITEDGFLGGRLRLRQPMSGHRAGHDAILLAAATVARPGQRIADFGAGVGAAGLAVARRVAGIELVLVEIDAAVAALASANAASNGIDASVVTLDLDASAAAFAAAGLGPDSVDGVLTNPPFNDPVRQQPSPDRARRAAHEATATTLENWIHAARRVLKPGGVLTLIWRAEGLDQILAALARGFGGVGIQPIHSTPSGPAIRILVRAAKGGRAPLRIFPGLVLNDSAGVPTSQANALLSGEAVLPLATQ
ncbi:MAG: methyltransferase [Rhizobiales bacterium]|nr:methyltransferase [Hyphomicrobiales bacterium]